MKKYIIIDRPGEWSGLETFGITCLNFTKLINGIRAQVLALDPEKYQIILPGASAADTWQQMQMPVAYSPLYIHAKRYSHDWCEGDPVVTVQTLSPNYMTVASKIPVIIDDVVSSGATIRLVRQRNRQMFPLAGDIWKVITPITRTKKLSGFDIGAATHVPSLGGLKPPLNSLSTLISYPEIRESYAARLIVPDQEQSFLSLFT